IRVGRASKRRGIECPACDIFHGRKVNLTHAKGLKIPSSSPSGFVQRLSRAIFYFAAAIALGSIFFTACTKQSELLSKDNADFWKYSVAPSFFSFPSLAWERLVSTITGILLVALSARRAFRTSGPESL